MTILILSLVIGILIGAVTCYLILNNHLRDKYEERYTRMFDEEVKDVWVRPHATTDCYDARKEYGDIKLFVNQRYRSKFLRGHLWVERSFMEHDFAIMSFLRYIHGAGCEVIIKDVSRKDIESNPEQADEDLKLMYKRKYNYVFQQITGRSWMDSDN